MKRLKRWGALMLSMVTAMVMVLPVSAASYDETEPVSLNIHKYEYDEDNTTQGKDGTGSEITPDSSWEAIANVKYTITFKEDMSGAAASGDLLDPYTNQAVEFVGTTDTNGNLIFNLGSYLAYMEEVVEAAGDTWSNDKELLYATWQLPHGVYSLVEETFGILSDNPDDSVVQSTSFEVYLPMTDPVALNEWIYNVHVYPKNDRTPEEIVVDKTVMDSDGDPVDDGLTAEAGDKVVWLVTSTVPAGIAYGNYYYLVDDLDDALVYESVKLYYSDGTSEVDLDPSTHYKVTYVSSYSKDASGDVTFDTSDELTAGTDAGGYVLIELNQEGRKELEKALDDPYDKTLYVEMTTSVIAETSYSSGTVLNEAEATYQNGLEENYTDTKKTTEENSPYLLAVRVMKVDENDEELAGAEFALKNKDGEYYLLDDDGKVQWVTDLSAATTHTTENDGLVTFGGLEEGTYYLEEVKAPAGYNLLTDDVEVSVARTGDGDNDPYDYVTVKGIQNKPGLTLPITGGPGTIIFTVIGLALMTAAVVVYSAYRRKRAQA